MPGVETWLVRESAENLQRAGSQTHGRNTDSPDGGIIGTRVSKGNPKDYVR